MAPLGERFPALLQRANLGLLMLPPIKLSFRPTNGYWEVPVLYEDDHLLALDKPADLPATPEGRGPDAPSLLGLLHAGIAAGAPWSSARSLTYLSVTHRLEAESSGVLLLAKSRAALTNLASQFGACQPNRQFLAVVNGTPREDAFEVNVALAPHPTKPGALTISPRRGKKTLTRFQVVERFARHAVIRCEPLTNRPQQIGVHLRWVKLPLVADSSAGGAPLLLSRLKRGYRFREDEPERPLLGRTALHLERITIARPDTDTPWVIEAPLPKDFRVALKYLRRYAV